MAPPMERYEFHELVQPWKSGYGSTSQNGSILQNLNLMNDNTIVC